jgi:hypothetical protein
MIENGQLDPANPGAVLRPSLAEVIVKCDRHDCIADATIIAKGRPYFEAQELAEKALDDYLNGHCAERIARSAEPIPPVFTYAEEPV